MPMISIDPGFARYYRPVLNTVWVIVIFGVLVSLVFFSGLPEFDLLGEYLTGRLRPPGILFAPFLFILIHAAVAALVYRMGTRHLLTVNRVLTTTSPRSVRIAVCHERRPGAEHRFTRWYADFQPGEATGDLPPSIRIAPPPGTEYRFHGLQEEAQVYFDGNPDNIVIRTSCGLLIAMKRDDVAYP